MYTVGVRRTLEADHFLTVADAGSENNRHTHHYEITALFESSTTDRNGYVIDICAIEECFEGIAQRYRGRLLNELPEFRGINPSIEHFARVLCGRFREIAAAGGISAVTVQIAENRDAYASFRQVLL